MTIDDRNIIWLDLFTFLTYQKRVKLLETFKKGEDIKQAFLHNQKIRKILTEEEISKMKCKLDDAWLDAQIARFEKDNIKFVTRNSEFYPQLLQEIDTPPLCLYCKGNLQLLNTNCVGIVGSRKPSEYGILCTKQYAKAFVEADLTIVSGLAAGVDTISHKTALENTGKTIAVLAGGLYHIYPAMNFSLAKHIEENNLVISENTPDAEALPYYFPIRNRIIAGLSKGVLVTEASLKSGSLHTANYANEYNREVFAIPGRINSDLSYGTNALIRTNSAHLTQCPEDVFALLGINFSKNDKTSAVQLDFKQQLVLNYIKVDKKSFQEILDHTGMTPQELNSMLLELEMEGLIIKLANNSYIMS